MGGGLRGRDLVVATAAVIVALLPFGAPAAAPTSPSGQTREWLSYGGDLGNQRYVSPRQINQTNIGRLGAVWVSAPFADGATSRMTPLVHRGRMFLAAGGRIYALDARTGKTIWAHRMEPRKSPGDATLSGLAMSRSVGLGLGEGMIFAGLTNDHVIALRESDGQLVWNTPVDRVPLPVSQGITSPPLYSNGKVFFGAGSEFSTGYVVAVQARSGRMLWKVPTAPEPGQPGHESWPRGSAIWQSGGAAPWGAPAADPALGLVYFVTGNPGPGAGGKVRPGDNLFGASVLALEMKTGKMRWYRQLIHHDLWEGDLSVPPVLFDAKLGTRGRKGRRKAIAVMRADGYLFEMDRATGEPLLPIDERPVPQNRAVFTAATQPFPRGAQSILRPCNEWAGRIPAGFTLGCLFDPPARDAPGRLRPYADVRIAPMSLDPQTGYIYAQGTNALVWFGAEDDPYALTPAPFAERIPDYPPPAVVLAAIDTRTGRVAWRRELRNYGDSIERSDGGSLSTGGGLIFHQGGDGTLQAYDPRSGRMLWRFQTDFAVGDASPMGYELDGKEYIAFISGTKVWAFALGGRVPQAPPIPAPIWQTVKGPIEDTDRIETLSLQPVQGNGHRYVLNEYAFNPYRARVRAGMAVTFINNGYLPHTIVARDGSWTTGTLGPTQVATISFEKPGTYLYFSKEYPWSYGELIVAARDRGGEASRQVAAGRSVYDSSCSACHGEDLTGRDPAPALMGDSFAARWVGRDARDLFERIRKTMPASAPGSLTEESYSAVVAFILYSNGRPASVKLDRNTMHRINVTR